MGCGGSQQKNNIKEQSIGWNTPIKIGEIECNNRVFMAPMTRCRADPVTSVPTDLMATYYSQRAGFGLIFTECSQISQRGSCYPGSGGIYTDEQTAGWKKVCDAVHAKGGKIALQIWHCGRVGHPKLNGGLEIWAPSPIKLVAQHSYLKEDYPVPHEMTVDEIKSVLKEFRTGAENAKKAGFDGIELNAANGFLVDQFLRDGTNTRQDEYGGSAEKRCRFCLEVMDELIAVFGKDRTGIRVSPVGRSEEMFDSNPLVTYSYLMSKLQEKGIAFVEVKEAAITDKVTEGKPTGREQMPDVASQLKSSFKGIIIDNEGFTAEKGAEALKKGVVSAITFAKMAITNPDLPQRIMNHWPLNTSIDFNTFFAGGEKGYIDYPNYIDWFSSLKIGDVECANRIIMAPLTRCRADPNTGIPTDLMVKYYEQRASYGLIITEGSQVSQRGQYFPSSGGIYTKEQAAGWKKVVDAVHAKGGKIALMIWHSGRLAHPKLNGDQEVWAPSAIKVEKLHPTLKEEHAMPHEMTEDEIKSVIQEFRVGAENAKEAGFDAIELGAGNGHLVDQFLRSISNTRTDDYGGSAENRCRFALEVIDALIAVFGKGRVGIRISPVGRGNEMFDQNPLETFTFLLQKLEEKGVAFIEVLEPTDDKTFKNELPNGKEQMKDAAAALRQLYKGIFINNEGFDQQSGLTKINQGAVQAISFGKLAITNPDLPNRFKNGFEVNTQFDANTYFEGGEKGYTDYTEFKKQ